VFCGILLYVKERQKPQKGYEMPVIASKKDLKTNMEYFLNDLEGKNNNGNYSITTKDCDSGEWLPSIRIFKYYPDAITFFNNIKIEK
jgi:hypothetical protein